MGTYTCCACDAGRFWGMSGIIPRTPTVGSTYSHTFTARVDTSWRKKYISLVGVIQLYDSVDIHNRQIVNVCEVPSNRSAHNKY
jgi:hypothetical protein